MLVNCNLRAALRLAFLPLAMAALSPGTAHAGIISFSFDYSGNTPGVGFLDPVNGLARQNALTTAGTLFSDLFGSHFSNTAILTIAVTSTDDNLSPVLASANSRGISAPGTFGGGEVVRNKLISNGATDLNDASPDGSVDVNWGYAWQIDPNVAATPPEFDFFAALFHEFTHALGFGSNILGTPGRDAFGRGDHNSGTWSKWDQFLVDCGGGGSDLVNHGNFQVDQTAYASAQANGGCFAGPNAVAAHAGLARLYADPDQSHLDEALFSTPNVASNFMMKPNRDPGPQEARIWSTLEVGILTDLGYTPVPEPGTWALVLVGLVVTRAVARRKA